MQATLEQDQDLIDAAENGDVAEVKELIKAGADVNAKTDDGRTALSAAKERGNTNIVKLLKAAGAKE